jgi:hypothetical protein
MSIFPGADMKASRIRLPSSLLIGMFWRLGFELLRRPVAVTAWLKEV